MPVYHIVLFKLKPDVSEAQKSELARGVSNMLGQVPGLRSIKIGPPHPSTAHRGKGFDMAVVAVLEQAEDIKVYAEHPAHLVVHKAREAICDDTLAYDMEFEE